MYRMYGAWPPQKEIEPFNLLLSTCDTAPPSSSHMNMMSTVKKKADQGEAR
jgi:hypothetical protein